MATETLIKRFEATAATYKEKGKREWAYAKNDLGDFHFGIAKDAFNRAKRNQEKADALKKSLASAQPSKVSLAVY